MHLSLSLLLTIAWSILPSSIANFNFSDHKVGFSFKVVIDAGHGGKDGGCVGAPHNEKNIVLPIALELGRLIETELPDVEVIYTREEDKFVALNKRAKIANDAQADLFISIHANSLPSLTSLRGSETYVMGLSEARANLAIAKRENASIYLEENYKRNYQGYDPNSNEGHILLSMFQNIHLEKSIEFAQLVEQSIVNQSHGHSRGVKQAGFLVLRATNMPSVLIETGYLTNVEDNTYLQDEAGQLAMSQAIFEAFKIYKRNQEIEQPIVATEQKQAAAPAQLVNQEIEVPKEVVNKSKIPQKEVTFVEIAEPTTDVIVYSVQLSASTKPLNTFSESWKSINSTIEVKKEGKYYKYLTGSARSLQEGKQLLRTVKAQGFEDAFLVAYKNGLRLKIVH